MIASAETFDDFDRSGAALLAHVGKRLRFRQERRVRDGATDGVEFVADTPPITAWASTYETQVRIDGGKLVTQKRIEFERIPFGAAGVVGSWSVEINGRWVPLGDTRTEDATFDAILGAGA